MRKIAPRLELHAPKYSRACVHGPMDASMDITVFGVLGPVNDALHCTAERRNFDRQGTSGSTTIELSIKDKLL